MRRALPLLLGLVMSGCSGHGADGIAKPPPMDFGDLVRPTTPNSAIAAPVGFSPAPDIVTRRYDVSPATLYAAVTRVALAQPRTYLHVAYDDRLEAHFVARSRLLNFPDLIAMHINPDGSLVLFSRSVYGQSDFGVNRKRLTAWLAALDADLATQR